eukprot:12413541-Karenia_brevis.AAC.1
MKGSRRRFAHCPLMMPSVNAVYQKYRQPGPDGGWSAIKVDNTVIDNLEDGFPEVPCVEVDMNVNKIYEEFVWQVHRASCRKGFPVGEIPSEIWRLSLLPQ